jgi:tryptophanyl-tRNA synthetase
VVTEAVNERLRPIRARHRELAADRGYLRSVLRHGNDRAAALAGDTLHRVSDLMRMTY